jgi:hypothetical protein
MSSQRRAGQLAVEIADFEIGALLGEGGEARVHEARYLGGDAELRSTAAVVAKLLADTTERSAIAGVNLLASVLNALDHAEPTVAPRFNVPIRVLVNGDDLVGYLLPRIRQQFLRTGRRFPEQSGAPRVAERLFLSRSLAESVGLRFATLAERLTVCRQLAEAFEFLHRQEYVYGDLSGWNVLYSLRPSAAVVLLDCDSLRMTGTATSNPQMTTPGWTQAGRSSLSRYTDQAKLSTFMLRALSPGAGAATANDPSRVRGAEIVGDERGRLPEIFRRANGSVTAAEWVTWLTTALERTESLDGWTRGRKGDWLRIR